MDLLDMIAYDAGLTAYADGMSVADVVLSLSNTKDENSGKSFLLGFAQGALDSLRKAGKSS